MLADEVSFRLEVVKAVDVARILSIYCSFQEGRLKEPMRRAGSAADGVVLGYVNTVGRVVVGGGGFSVGS